MICEWCGTERLDARPKQRFCSPSCASKQKANDQWSSGKRKREEFLTLACERCAGPFKTLARRPGRFCSRRCALMTVPRRYGKDNPQFQGGLIFGRQKRIHIVCRDGSLVAMSRAVVEADVRRPLDSEEIVHHINGDQTDDRLENLQVMTRAEHARIHMTGRGAARIERKAA